MKNNRKFNPKSIEVSHVEIEIHLPKLWNLEEQFWFPYWKPLELRKTQT